MRWSPPHRQAPAFTKVERAEAIAMLKCGVPTGMSLDGETNFFYGL
jgi:hypothetical protein